MERESPIFRKRVTLLCVALLLIGGFLPGCSAKQIPEFHVDENAIILGKRELTEEDFFMKITGLKSKHKVVCDVHDQESSRYINDTFLPRLRQQLEKNPELRKYVEIEVREE